MGNYIFFLVALLLVKTTNPLNCMPHDVQIAFEKKNGIIQCGFMVVIRPLTILWLCLRRRLITFYRV